MRFGLIGDGKIAVRHRAAIKNNGGNMVGIHDPKYGSDSAPLDFLLSNSDYVVICSPSFMHREHINSALKHDRKIIVEKPMVLPWEPMIDNNNINVVLQLRWIDLPESAEIVESVMVRNDAYFETWEGNAKLTGGLFYHLFIHYIDLAIKLKSKFVGTVISEGTQVRRIDHLDIMKLDMDKLYTDMYNDIINHDKGVKPSELFYVHWALERCGWKYGLNSTDLLNKKITVDFSHGVAL